jgi:hypothetical protein
MQMKRIGFLIAVFGLTAIVGGCRTQQSDTDAIRAGINEHLTGLKTINLSAMDVDIESVTITGSQAQAKVEFRPKTGAPAGAGMEIAYSLEKQNGTWVVQSTQAAGGNMTHPDPNSNPHMNPGMNPAAAGPANSSSSTSLPNFRDLVPGGGAPTSSALPPGHPAVQ